MSARTRPVAGAGVTLALCLAAAGCGGGEAAPGEPAPVAVDAAVAASDTLVVRVRAVGSLEAAAQVEVRAEADGRVERVLFREGEAVDAGQVLMHLDRQKRLAELQVAQAAAERARAEASNLARQLERNRGLLEAGAISPQAFEDLATAEEAARTRRAEAEARVRLAREALADATVRAPFAGRTGERRVSAGDFVSRADPLVGLVDDTELEIGFSVPERYVGRLGVGRPVEVTVTAYPERSFVGDVSFVSPVVDPASRTVRVKATIPNADGALRSGLFADVTLELERRPDAVVVPEAAVVSRGGETFIFLVTGGLARERAVRLGERSPGVVEVREGVSAGDTVVVAGQQKLGEGVAVSPTLVGATLESADDGAPAG